MTNIQIMLKALNKNVIPKLLEQGFIGKYPHFRREKEECVEFISFDANKYGGSFTVELSAIFPNSEYTNYLDDTVAENVWGTSNRYRLDGMLDGWFHYDNENFTLETAEKICDKVNKQFEKAFILLDKFEKSDNKEIFQFENCENNANKKQSSLFLKIIRKLKQLFR